MQSANEYNLIQLSERKIAFNISMGESAPENKGKTALYYWKNEQASFPEGNQFLNCQ